MNSHEGMRFCDFKLLPDNDLATLMIAKLL